MTVAEEDSPVDRDEPYRLPRNAVPSRYVLELAPNLSRATFMGRAQISLRVDEELDQLVLNAAELNIEHAELRLPDGSSLHASEIALDEAEQRATLSFYRKVAPGDGYTLILRFKGILNDKLHGFYRSTHQNPDGSTTVIASTQFEATDARRAFPCWDEPDFKATFAVTLIVAEGLTALSNGPVESERPNGDGRNRITFAETMPMSTYLVAFVVGPFELAGPVNVDGVELRVAALPGKADLTAFGMKVGEHSLRFLSDYFGIAYPAGKLDHVAIPDFAFGAMENLGCVTYRETALLVDPAAASQMELQRVTQVVAHETSHMWFGDLVTMKWWNGIWLNEAFATFMEQTTTDAFEPAWKVWASFGAGRAAALATDGLTSTRPVEFTVGRPEEAEAMFDVLTYQKGGSVLKMLEQYLGPDAFRQGISAYLAENAYGNTETTDLWDAIEEVSGEPVRSMMDTWIFQKGYPVLSVERSPKGVVLSQKRFLYRGEGDESWVVPVQLRAKVGPDIVEKRLLLDGPRTEVSFEADPEWVVVNAGAWGFFRVRYSPELAGALAEGGLLEVLEPQERQSLMGDASASFVSGGTELKDLAATVLALREERDPDVWSAMLGPVGLLDLIAPEDARSSVAAFTRRLVGPLFESLGWDPAPDEDQRTGVLRGRLLGALGTVGADPVVRGEARSRFDRFLADRSSLSPDLVSAVVGVVAASGDATTYQMLKEQYLATNNPQDKVRYLQSLAGFEDPSLLAQTLDYCLTDEVRAQDAPFLIGAVAGSRFGARYAWSWLPSHWDEITAKFPALMLLRVLEGMTGVVDADLAADVHAFIASHDLPVAGPRVAQLEERMDINVSLAQRVGSTISEILDLAE